MFSVDSVSALPAPFWFVEFFKVLGFVLHVFAMNLWFAGLPLAILAFVLSTKNSRRLALRLFSQLPIIVALGINFGIVPLLFIQTAYYKVFYTSTILMAWHWFLVIPLLIFAYYGIYICAFSVGPTGKKRYLIPFGLISVFSLLMIAYIFVNAMSLLGRPDTWAVLYENHQIGGATLGLGINNTDPTLWLRYGSMFGLALVTSSVWIVFDAQVLIRKTSDNSQSGLDISYRRFAKRFSVLFSLGGAALFAGMFWQYLGILRNAPITADWAAGNVGTILAWSALALPALIFALILLTANRPIFAWILILLQVVSISVFAIFRQFIQNLEVSQVLDVARLPENVQWDVLFAFLATFVLGALVIAWMVRRTIIATAPNKG